MPISLNCSCGKTLPHVADEHAGRRVKCPVCSAIIAAPSAEPDFEVVEDDPPQKLTATKPKPAARKQDDDDEDGSYGVTKAEESSEKPKKKPNFRKGSSADDDEDDDRERRRRRKRRAARQASEFNSRRMSFIAGGALGLIGGIALAIWGNSLEGRSATRLLIFGVILGLCGLVSLFQGITGNLPDEDD